MSRINAREWVVKFLFQMDVREEDYRDLLEQFVEYNPIKPDEENFLRQNVEGVVNHLEQIDDLIQDKLVKWTIDRLPGVDVAVLRNALYEILYQKDIPVSVAINEAVEIAKKYSNDGSGAFVNGILGNFVREKNLQ